LPNGIAVALIVPQGEEAPMKLAITAQGSGLDSALDPRFGRAKFFVVVDTETGAFSAIDNAVNLNAAQGAGIQAGKRVVELGVDGLITGHAGPKAFTTLRSSGLKVYTGAAGTVADAIEQFKSGRLTALESADVDGHWS
jgi:predicted Fe-Mo cluster-binding NifX family protein